jgi:hypothetical protein
VDAAQPGASTFDLGVFRVLPAVAATVAAASITAAAAAIASSAATAASASAAASAAIVAGTSFINDHVSTVVFLAVELRDSVVRIVFGRHFDEPEPARTAGLAIHDYIRRFDSTGSCEVILKIFTRHTK